MQMDFAAISVTLMVALLCALYSASAALPVAASSPWVPKYMNLQIVYSAVMLLTLCSGTAW